MELSDLGIHGHGRRVALIARALLRELRISSPEADLTLAAALLHDIGKIGLPACILAKPGCLDREEKRTVDTHSQRGADWLRRRLGFGLAADYVLHHHERWDGRGYPGRLKGWEIPRGARVIAVADSLDALTSDRPYRAGLSLTETRRILHAERGRQWDPAIVDAALRLMDRGRLPVRAPRPASVAPLPAFARPAAALWQQWCLPQPAFAPLSFRA
jgi:HD-GYP domain-containing protein (c-di-GMP phosphodiesterase class II)